MSIKDAAAEKLLKQKFAALLEQDDPSARIVTQRIKIGEHNVKPLNKVPIQTSTCDGVSIGIGRNVRGESSTNWNSYFRN